MAEDMGKAELEQLCAGIADKLLIGAALNIVAQTMTPPDADKAVQQVLQTAEDKIPENSTLFGKLDDQQNAVLRAAIVEYMRRSLANAQTASI